MLRFLTWPLRAVENWLLRRLERKLMREISARVHAKIDADITASLTAGLPAPLTSVLTVEKLREAKRRLSQYDLKEYVFVNPRWIGGSKVCNECGMCNTHKMSCDTGDRERSA